MLTDPAQIQTTTYAFYKKLFEIHPPSTLRLAEEVWHNSCRMDPADIEELTKPFTEEEVKRVVFDTKEHTAPGPDGGFSVSFYKHCWEIIKGELMELIYDFYLGNSDIAKLNYGVITLVPNVKEVNKC